MLEPNNRSLLTEQLQAPRGFELVQAIGTTFTLDLSTAIGIPLSFASRSFAEHDDLGIIAALSQYADRISIFTQAGQIGVGVRSDLVALLEDVVHPVHPARGIFHPKVWLLEYAAGEKRTYRFLCNSRNLTEDRSWDLSVRLDGVPARDDQLTTTRELNRPLVSLLQRLPTLAVNPLQEERSRRIRAFSDRIRNVQWELPSGVTDLRFHLLGGLGEHAGTGDTDSVTSMLNVRAREALIISPFLSPEGIETVSRITTRAPRLVSRAESLDQLPDETVQQLGDTYVLDDLLTLDEEADEQAGASALTGLHAKAVFVSERSHPSRARAYIGSANVTSGGLRNNIEMMVELRGHVKDLGPSGVYEALGSMLEPFVATGGVESDAQTEATRRLEARVRALAAGRVHARISGNGPYMMSAWYEERTPGALDRMEADGIIVEWRPLAVTGEGAKLSVHEDTLSEFRELRVNQITPFLQLSVKQKVEGEQISVRTIVSAELHDDIPGRRDAILARGITDGDQFLKLLMLLLTPEHHALQVSTANGDSLGAAWSTSSLVRGLFESLLRSLARGDEGLDIAQRVLAQLRQQAGKDLQLPEDFEELWDNVWEARATRREKGAER